MLCNYFSFYIHFSQLILVQTRVQTHPCCDNYVTIYFENWEFLAYPPVCLLVYQSK